MKTFDELLKYDYLKTSTAVLLIGMGAGLVTYVLHESVHYLSYIAGTTSTFTLETYAWAILFALTSYGLTKTIFKDTNGSGIPQVSLRLVAYKGKMPKRMPLGKFLTSFFTLCSGLSFGKEGPLVTISAAWAHLISHMLKLNREVTKVLVSSGATAGLAAAFNTPIAAVVFTIEEILGALNTRYLGPIIVTSVIASVTSYNLLGKESFFVPLHYRFEIEWHLILYFILGLIMSIVGFFFVNAILFFKGIKKKRFQKVDYIFVVLAVVVAGLCSQHSSEVLGDGTQTINRLLIGGGSELLTPILMLFALKLLLITISYSSGLSGGLFMPVLFLGALGGTAFGTTLIHLGIENIEVGSFALLGMTSLLVAVIRTPFTAFVMLFEMSRDYEFILPLMVSSITAYWISSIIRPGSVYDSVAEYEGVHLPTQSENEVLNEMTVEECMVQDVVCLNEEHTLEEIKELVDKAEFGGFPVLKNSKLVGMVNKYEIQENMAKNPQTQVKDILQSTIISIYPDQDLLVAFDKMKRFDVGRLPVVSRLNDKKILGIITPEDVVDYLGLTKTEAQSQKPKAKA